MRFSNMLSLICDSIFSHHNKQHKHFFNLFVYFRSVRCGQRVFAKPQFDCKPRAAKFGYKPILKPAAVGNARWHVKRVAR